MDWTIITRRINRKCGTEVLTESQVMSMWILAGEILEKEGAPLEGDLSNIFRKKWIQCRVKQLPGLWPQTITWPNGEIVRVDMEANYFIGKEDEENLMDELKKWIIVPR